MSIDEKVEQVLVDGEYITTSQIEADEVIKRAKEQGYEFSSRYFEEYEILISQ